MSSSAKNEGFALWLTGMSGAGKTTLALRLKEDFQERALKVELLDGDVIRGILGTGLGFSREDRVTNLQRVSFVAGLLAKHGVIVICSFITPYEICRSHARNSIEHYIEVYVKCPVEILIQRDPKGLYKRALSGEISNFTGLTDPYEEPAAFDICVETDKETVAESFRTIVNWLEAKERIPVKPEQPVGLTLNDAE